MYESTVKGSVNNYSQLGTLRGGINRKNVLEQQLQGLHSSASNLSLNNSKSNKKLGGQNLLTI